MNFVQTKCRESQFLGALCQSRHPDDTSAFGHLRLCPWFPNSICIMGSHNFKGTATVVYLAYIAGCSAIYILHYNIQEEELWHMTTSAQSWPDDGVWPTFQEKKEGVG